MARLHAVSDLASMFVNAGCRGWVHVEALDGSGSVSLEPEEPVVTASTFKVFVALELFAQAEEGRVDLTTRARIEPDDRTYGPTGLSRFHDAADVSLRDLAYLMLSVSDNAATDVLIDAVGLDSVNARLERLGLADTFLPSDLGSVLDTIAGHVGFTTYRELAAAQEGQLGEVAQALAMDLSLIPSCPVFEPLTTIHTTARDMARWLTLVWRDEAAAFPACEQVRNLMTGEAGNRWGEVLPPPALASTKGGSLAGMVRNQVGVVEFPEGDAYALAIFTRADHPFQRTNDIWRVIREVAGMTVRELRDR